MVYSISQSLGYTLVDEALEFEGISRPTKLFLLRDAERTPEDNVILERYFNDMYALFIGRLSALALGNKIASEDERKLRSLLEEMLKVKGLIERAEYAQELKEDINIVTSRQKAA